MKKIVNDFYFNNVLSKYSLFCSPIPCSSLLVRLLPAACYPDGEAKKAADFPEDEWVTEGVLVHPTSYHEGERVA